MRGPTLYAWLAALIDGEGSIMLVERTPDSGRRRHLRAVVSVSNTDTRLMKSLLREVGQGRVYTHKNPRRGVYAFTWRLTGLESLKWLPKLIPYLVIKRRQAKLLIEAIELGQKLAPIKGEEYDWALMPRLKRRREEIMLQIRSLNRKGKNKWRINPSQ